MQILTTLFAVVIIALACPGGHSQEKSPKQEFTVLLLPNGSPLPTSKIGTVFTTAHYSIDKSGRLKTEKGIEVTFEQFKAEFGDPGIADAKGAIKTSFVIAIQINDPKETSIAIIQTIVVKIRKSVPADRPVFVCVSVDP